MKNILYLLIVGCLLSCGNIGNAKKEWITNFDLDLEGEVIETKFNEYGQLLVCLNVISSNHEFYCPIHDPNEGIKNGKGNWEKRFFVNVIGNKAVFICDPEPEYSKIYDNLIAGAIVTINEDSSKAFRVYNDSKTYKYGALSMLTFPVRNNLEYSCGE